jgi:hypothetical protein
VRVLRMSAAEWRNRARRIAPAVLCLLWCLGCSRLPSREVAADFDVERAVDVGSVLWTLRFTRDHYHAMLDSAQDDTETAKVRELIGAGLKLHHIAGCSPRERVATRLSDGSIVIRGLLRAGGTCDARWRHLTLCSLEVCTYSRRHRPPPACAAGWLRQP